VNVFDFALVCGAVGITVVGGLMVAMSRKHACPACRARTLAVDTRPNAGGIDLATGGRLYRCLQCGVELVRHHDKGPFIPRAAWDAGSRTVPPVARALPPKERS
jgi:hypothetical protein